MDKLRAAVCIGVMAAFVAGVAAQQQAPPAAGGAGRGAQQPGQRRRERVNLARHVLAPERGVQLVTRLRRHMRGIAERAASVTPVRVACIEWIEPLMAAGNWTPELISMAGAVDVLAEQGGGRRDGPLLEQCRELPGGGPAEP